MQICGSLRADTDISEFLLACKIGNITRGSVVITMEISVSPDMPGSQGDVIFEQIESHIAEEGNTIGTYDVLGVELISDHVTTNDNIYFILGASGGGAAVLLAGCLCITIWHRGNQVCTRRYDIITSCIDDEVVCW